MRMPLPLCLALLTAAPLAAQEAEPEVSQIDPVVVESQRMQEAPGFMLSADDLEDAVIYALGSAYDAEFWESGEPFGAVAGDWDQIGEVDDVIIDASGQVVGLTTDVGGFLGLGENTVLLPLDQIRLVQVPDDDSFFVITRLDREALEAQEEFELDWDD